MDSKKRKEPSANTAAAASAAAGGDAEEKRPRRKKRMEMTKEERKAQDKLEIVAKRTCAFVAYRSQIIDRPWMKSGVVHAVNINAAITSDLKSQGMGMGDRMNVMHVLAETSYKHRFLSKRNSELANAIRGAWWECGGKAVINDTDSRGLRPIDTDCSLAFLETVMACDLKDDHPVVDWSANTAQTRFHFLRLVETNWFQKEETFRQVVSRLSPESWDVCSIDKDTDSSGRTLLNSAAIAMTLLFNSSLDAVCPFDTPESKKMLVERSTDRALEHFRVRYDDELRHLEQFNDGGAKLHSVWNEMLTLVTAEEAVRLERVGAALDEWNRSVIDFYLLSPLISIVKGYL